MCLPGPVDSMTLVGESNASQSSAEALMSGQQEKQMPTHDKSKEREPVSVKANNDVVKFVMDHPAFAAELADQLQHLNAEIQWEAGTDVITIVQKSAEIFVPRWSEECQSSVKKFFKRFRKESYRVQKDIQDSICNKLEEIKNSVSSFEADCWLVSNNGMLVLVSLKTSFVSVSKTVKDFLEDARIESKKLKQIVECVDVSSDHVDYLDRVQFLDTVKQIYHGIIEATITDTRNEIRFVGSSEAILDAKQLYEDFIEQLSTMRLQLPMEVMKFISKEAGLQFIDQCLDDREISYVIVMEGEFSVKVISQSPKKCNEVKECLCNNVFQTTIPLAAKDEHILTSKKWEEILKTIQSEQLVDCQVNTVNGTPRDIKLHGAAYLVQKYNKQVTDFIKSQEVFPCKMCLPSAIVRYIKEKSNKELEKIESDLEEEKVTISIQPANDLFECLLSGTNKGIRESQKRIVAVSREITSRSTSFSSVGVAMLLFSENGRQNIKVIEAETDTIIEVGKVPVIVKEELSQSRVKAMQAESLQRNTMMKQIASAPIDPFDQCNFTTSEGLHVSWKYGNIAEQRVSILLIISNDP